MNLLTNQMTSLRLPIVIILGVSLCIIGAVFSFHITGDVELKMLTNDIAAIAELPPYAGVQSQIGIFIWAAAATICFFSLAFIKEMHARHFLKTSGYITVLLGLDDVFMFHEIVFPALGIHQKIVFLSYVIIILIYGMKFLRLILKTDYLLLGFAGFWLALSLFVDNFMWDYSPLVTKLLEDGAKLVGIVAWLVYFGRTCQQMIQRNQLKTS